jgi:prepilin-type N-terminal cleavage/methylation domain-containing protein
MSTTARLNHQAAVRGFTLIELLLALVLLTLLAGSLVVNFSAMQASAQLDEAASQLESAIRFARAHAASTGCKVRLSFEEEVGDDMAVPLGNVFVEWEPDPLTRPGVYEILHQASLLIENLLESAQIDDVRALNGSGSLSEPAESGEGEESEFFFAPIMFYPDGSSDSAEIILASRDEQESRRISIRIIGETGAIRRGDFNENEFTTEEEWFDFVGE